jgi:hypothetical protein
MKNVVQIAETNILKSELTDFAKWFNITQWEGGKGDIVKIMFTKCDYNGIVNEYLKIEN